MSDKYFYKGLNIEYAGFSLGDHYCFYVENQTPIIYISKTGFNAFLKAQL